MMNDDLGRPSGLSSDDGAASVSTLRASIPDASFSLDSLRAAIKLLDDIPPVPLLASWDMFPRDNAITVKWGGRDYVGAHPDFWKQVPAAERGTAASLFALEIADFSLPYYEPQKREFITALAQAMSAGTAETAGLRAEPASAVRQDAPKETSHAN